MKGIFIIAALGSDRGIGKDNKLLWHIPDDLKRFKQLTLGHAVIMGRKTFESIAKMLGGPLPGRQNIVISRNPSWKYRGVITISSTDDPLIHAWAMGHTDNLFFIGGAEIYRYALPLAERLYLTLIDAQKPADTFFPPYKDIFTKVVFEEKREWKGLKYRWVDLEK